MAARAAPRGIEDEPCDALAKSTCEEARLRLSREPDFAARHREWRKSGALAFAGLLLAVVLLTALILGLYLLLVPILAVLGLTMSASVRDDPLRQAPLPTPATPPLQG